MPRRRRSSPSRGAQPSKPRRALPLQSDECRASGIQVVPRKSALRNLRALFLRKKRKKGEAMDYRLSYEYTYRDFVGLNQVYSRTRHRALNVCLRAVLGLCGALLLVLTGFELADGVSLLVPVILQLLLGLFFLASALFASSLSALASRARVLKGIGRLEIGLDDEGVHVKTLKADEKYFYTAATGLFYRRGTWYMFVDKAHALLFPAAAFTQGDPAGFGDYLALKCGLPVKTLK